MRGRRTDDRTLAEEGVAANKEGARRKLATIAFLDETGFMLQPTRRRTWAPRGKTPIHKAWDRRDRLSVIGSVTVSPRRCRLDLYFLIQARNVTQADLVHFVSQLRARVRTPLVLVWDRSGPHRGAAKQLQRRYPGSVRIEWLPPYSPKLNPQEHCWDQTKFHDLSNFLPEDVHHLRRTVADSISQQRTRPEILRSHFAYAKLAL